MPSGKKEKGIRWLSIKEKRLRKTGIRRGNNLLGFFGTA